MQLPYTWKVGLAGALVSTYFAKKRAEIAPGVGTTTDMAFINAVGFCPVTPEDMASLERLHADGRRMTERIRQAREQRFLKESQRRYEKAQSEVAAKAATPSDAQTPAES